MPTQPLSAEKVQQIKDLLAEGKLKRDEIARLLGVGQGTVSKYKAEIVTPKASEEIIPERTDELSGDSWNISIKKTNLSSVDELIEECKVDLEIWEIDKCQIRHWGMGFVRKAVTTKSGDETVTVRESGAQPLYSISATLKKKKHVVDAKAEIEELRKEALKYSPKFTGFKPRKPAGSGVAVEFSLADHHFGGLIWGEETSGEDWDNKIAASTWRTALESLVNKVRGFSPEMAVLVLGHDQQNADNRSGSTENLTPQSMDSRYQKVYSVSKAESKWAIDKLIAEYGRVHVIMVPGNHDPLATFHLGDYLATWYRNCPGVTIDNSIPMRKWWEWGVVMLMLEHGGKGKLEKYGEDMAAERPEMWGRTKWRESHTGHVHHRKMIETKGATIRSLPSLRPSCAWSTENHHTGSIRAAEAFVWSKTEGLIGQATFSILRKSEAA